MERSGTKVERKVRTHFKEKSCTAMNHQSVAESAAQYGVKDSTKKLGKESAALIAGTSTQQ